MSRFHTSAPSTFLCKFKLEENLSEKEKCFRYQDDVYDRRWAPYAYPKWQQITTPHTIDEDRYNDYQLPSIVMRSAATPKNKSEPLLIDLVHEDSTSKFYMYMHFAELEELQANQSRQFNISFNGNHLYGPVVPSYRHTTTAYTTSALTGEKLQFSIHKTENSTLPPILNAIEFYLVQDFSQSETEQADGKLFSIFIPLSIFFLFI